MTLHSRLAPLKTARSRTLFTAVAASVFGVFVFIALHRILSGVHLHDVRAAFHAVPVWRIGIAIALTALSYGCLTLYDVLALRIIRRPEPYRVAALASFASYALSHNFGFALLTGTSARYRIYSSAGLEVRDILRVVAIASMTFWLGAGVLTGAMLILDHDPLAIGGVAVSATLQRIAGIALTCIAGLLLILAGRTGQVLRPFGWSLPLPTAGQATAQIIVATLDLAAASAALFILVPGLGPDSFPGLFLGYIIATVVALISHIPGGLGVFEAVVLSSLPNIDEPALVAAMIAYRAIYYLLPLILATIAMLIHESREWRRAFGNAFDMSQAAVSGIAPVMLSALSFVGGGVLLVSGSLPAIPERLHLIRDIVPLPFVEASHIAASLAGTGLLLLAPGLYRRLDAAFLLTRGLLLAGALFSLAKGFDFEEASILLVIAALLQWMRPIFYRRTALTGNAYSTEWVVMVVFALGLSFWIGIFSFKHVAYQSDLWWEFAWKGDASRFLRASFGAAIFLIGAITVRMFGPASSTVDETQPDNRNIDAVLAASERTDALLALTGDKRFVFSPSGNAFVMYQLQGHSWIVMGDPVGPKDEWPDMLWQLRERADAAQGRLLLYQLTAAALPLAIDLGLHLIKYGEEARVDLATFTLDGPAMKALRHAERRAARDGAVFEIVPSANLPALIPELRSVSNAWLGAKGHGEKSFSVGRFDPAYLARFDCALVRQEGRVIAFANIWSGANQQELSVDLMRHADALPYGTMDFLFVRLMMWGKQEGYRWFAMGAAPLSGIEARRLAPIWARAGGFLYRRGKAFYGFSGLRTYKEKFLPSWEPRFIAGPRGMNLARALIDLQTLVSGNRNSAAHQVSLEIPAL